MTDLYPCGSPVAPSSSQALLVTLACPHFEYWCSTHSLQGAADMASQVVSRLLALLKDKERKWRVELHRASQLEGENAELRARLAAAEQSNGRLRSRLHSGVAAFHRTLAQAKDKMETKEGELSSVKAQALELQGLCGLGAVKAGPCRAASRLAPRARLFLLAPGLCALPACHAASDKRDVGMCCRKAGGEDAGGRAAAAAGGAAPALVLLVPHALA